MVECDTSEFDTGFLTKVEGSTIILSSVAHLFPRWRVALSLAPYQNSHDSANGPFFLPFLIKTYHDIDVDAYLTVGLILKLFLFLHSFLSAFILSISILSRIIRLFGPGPHVKTGQSVNPSISSLNVSFFNKFHLFWANFVIFDKYTTSYQSWEIRSRNCSVKKNWPNFCLKAWIREVPWYLFGILTFEVWRGVTNQTLITFWNDRFFDVVIKLVSHTSLWRSTGGFLNSQIGRSLIRIIKFSIS